MNARSFGHSRQDGNIMSSNNRQSDHNVRDMRRKNTYANNCTDDTCSLLCQDDSSMDCPLLSKKCSSFKRRASQQQIPHMTRLESSISINSLNAAMPHMEERMRRRLKYFFMNPCQKYQAKRRKPFKLVIQILKIALVTAQLNIFGAGNQTLVNFRQENDEAFFSTFLGHNGSFYTKSEVYSQINDVREGYATWKNNSIGIFDYPTGDIRRSLSSEKNISVNEPPPVKMCITSYSVFNSGSKSGKLYFNEKDKNKTCMLLKVWNQNDSEPTEDSIPLTDGTQFHIDFIRLISVTLDFRFVTMQVKLPTGFTAPTCFNVTVNIKLDNSERSGRITGSLDSQYHMTQCNEETKEPINAAKVLLNVFDSIIVLFCLASLILCARSLWKAQVLRKGFEKFFLAQYNKKLTFSDQLEFFNMWYLLIIISDILTILGSISKVILQNKDTGIVDYNICSIFLGVGCLCVWVGVLRYAGFFQKYNILVLTLKKALPHVCRFMVCASLLYLGFMFCGWVVLGPHHHKFRSLVVTSEALFSLINGDDMYMTYEEMSHKSTGMVVFSQIYLYTFISLFIYVVLSLFIAVIMDTYETIKERQDGTESQQSELEKFIAPCTADASVENYGFDGLNSATRCCCCCFGNDEDFDPDDDMLDE